MVELGLYTRKWYFLKNSNHVILASKINSKIKLWAANALCGRRYHIEISYWIIFILKCWNKVSWIVSWCDWVRLGAVNFWKSCPWWDRSCRWSVFCICRSWGRAIWSIVNCLPCLKCVCQAFVYSHSRIGVYNPWAKRKYTLQLLL